MKLLGHTGKLMTSPKTPIQKMSRALWFVFLTLNLLLGLAGLARCLGFDGAGTFIAPVLNGASLFRAWLGILAVAVLIAGSFVVAINGGRLGRQNEK